MWAVKEKGENQRHLEDEICRLLMDVEEADEGGRGVPLERSPVLCALLSCKSCPELHITKQASTGS